MKTTYYLFTCVLLLCTVLSASGQQRYYGQWALSGGGGYGNEGWHTSISGEKYISRTLSGIRASFNFARQQKKVQEWKIPLNRYTLGISYFYSLERYMSEKFFLNVGGGFFIGGEDFRKIKLPYGVIQTSGMRFIAGISINPQLEFILKNNISGFIEPQVSLDFCTHFKHYLYSVKIGMKYYF